MNIYMHGIGRWPLALALVHVLVQGSDSAAVDPRPSLANCGILHRGTCSALRPSLREGFVNASFSQRRP